MTFADYASLSIAAAACVTDIWTRRIPNVLTFGAAAGACGHFVVAGGLAGLGWALAGWGLGLVVFLPLFMLRGIGGGDVKLMAALGAWIGPRDVIWLALYAALAGGPLALVVALSRGYLRQAFVNVWSLLTFWRVAGFQAHPTLTLDSPGTPRLPYALPIAVGLVATIWLQR